MAMAAGRCASGVLGVCGSLPPLRAVKSSVKSSSQGSVYGERLLPKVCRGAGRKSCTSPCLICVAVVWWSDAYRQIQPDWKKVQKLRLEKLATSQPSSDQPVTEASNGNAVLYSLKSGLKSLLSAGCTPEVILGRTAMLGFFAATTVEFETGKSVLQQLTFRGDIFATVVAVGVLLMSLRRLEEDGTDALFHPSGFFNPKAERLSGQAAMVGFALLVVIESARGSALF